MRPFPAITKVLKDIGYTGFYHGDNAFEKVARLDEGEKACAKLAAVARRLADMFENA